MEINIQDRLSILLPEYQEFIQGSFITEAADQLGKASGFGDKKISVLENAFTLYFLLFMDNKEVIDFIKSECEVSLNDAENLTYALLTSLPEEYRLMQKTAYDYLNTTTEEDPSNETGHGVDSKPATQTQTENRVIPETVDPVSIPKIRTMSADMTANQDKETTQSTSQEDLLNRKS